MVCFIFVKSKLSAFMKWAFSWCWKLRTIGSASKCQLECSKLTVFNDFGHIVCVVIGRVLDRVDSSRESSRQVSKGGVGWVVVDVML